MLARNGCKTCKSAAVKIFFVHINSRYLMVVIGCVVINPLAGIAARCVYGYLKFAALQFAAAPLLLCRAENVKKLTDAFLLAAAGDGVHFNKSGSCKARC